MRDTTRRHLYMTGYADAVRGRSIAAYYDMPLPSGMRRHTEAARAYYERGYRDAKREMDGRAQAGD